MLPDVDGAYMKFVTATTGSGGWPLSIWCTPDLKPFFGGTYFPPTDQYGRPAFATVCEALGKRWQEDKHKLQSTAARVVEALKESAVEGSTTLSVQLPSVECVARTFNNLSASFDSIHGGFGGFFCLNSISPAFSPPPPPAAPKFPTPVLFNFLFTFYSLRGGAGSGAEVNSSNVKRSLEMATFTLEVRLILLQIIYLLSRVSTMAASTIISVVASIDTPQIENITCMNVSVVDLPCRPHFEKMLYDQVSVGGGW